MRRINPALLICMIALAIGLGLHGWVGSMIGLNLLEMAGVLLFILLGLLAWASVLPRVADFFRRSATTPREKAAQSSDKTPAQPRFVDPYPTQYCQMTEVPDWVRNL